MNFNLKKYAFLISCLFFAFTKTADLVIFSYDRPMQLYALLESSERHIAGITSATVIYRVSGEDYQAGYKIVQERFPTVNFVQQLNPPQDFRDLVEKAAFKDSSSKYIIFAVDDIFVKGPVDLEHCAILMEKYRAYCFSLRLSPQIDYCYMLDRYTGVPVLEKKETDVYKYYIKSGDGDWNYPNNVDMTLYRKQDIYQNIMVNAWHNPNQLEGSWASKANLDEFSLIFDESKIVNIPLNLVNKSTNRFMNSYSTQELLTKFLCNYKIDISLLEKFKHNSAHIDYDIVLLKR